MVLFAVAFALFNSLQALQEIANPDYVDEMQTVFEFVYDLLPTGQMASMNELELTRMHRWPLLSVLLASVVTLIGFRAFKKKDIK